MTPKERILAAIDHKPVDKIPADYWGTPEVTEKLMEEMPVSNLKDLWTALKIDKIIKVNPTTYIGPKFDMDDPYINPFFYWGVKTKPISYGDNIGVYHEISYYPLENINSIEDIEKKYTWPKADWFNFDNIVAECKKYPEYAIESGYIAPFHMYNNIRGLEKNLIDFALNEELAFYIINKICDFLYDYHERLLDAADGYIDIMHITDDFGTQNGLMISIEMFEKYFEKQYQRFIKLLKDHNVKVFHHDDGAIMLIIPKMVDLGIDILNPIQWHLPGMDLHKLKQSFGKQICFHGGIDNQYVLPFGNITDVKNEVITCLETLANDKTGYILAPCHSIQPNTPIENIKAMYLFAAEYGKF